MLTEGKSQFWGEISISKDPDLMQASHLGRPTVSCCAPTMAAATPKVPGPTSRWGCFFRGIAETGVISLITTSSKGLGRRWKLHLGVSENSVPLNPMVLLIIIPIKWLFHWEYTQHFQVQTHLRISEPCFKMNFLVPIRSNQWI